MESQITMYGENVGQSRIADNEWGYFADPDEHPEFFEHMTDKIKVQFLGESWEKGPWIVPNRFSPNLKADRHAHNHDTIYYILEGSMTFNDGSGWMTKGDLRWVRAGHIYGPEEAGPEGCDFLLVSAGPIDVEWDGAETFKVES
jgi:mannose-6-phosphate isomerase-like protein (cupin superfamily)